MLNLWERVNVANRVIPAKAGIHHQAQCKAVCSHLYGNGRFNYSNPWVRESIRGANTWVDSCFRRNDNKQWSLRETDR